MLTRGLLVILLSCTYDVDALAFKKIKKIKRKLLGPKSQPYKSMPPLEPIPFPAPNGDEKYAFKNKDIENIFEQNKEWIKSKTKKDPNFFKEYLGGGHKPSYLWIGCSDARVPANEIMGEDAGSVFTVRNVANMVIGTDFNTMSALQYAVNVLNVPHIIVCGHYDCGGVRASIENRDHVPPLENWLRNIRDVYRLHRKELDKIKDPEQRHRRLVELNVIEQCINLFKTGAVQRHRVETYKRKDLPYSTPRIHACVFEPATGELKQLQIDFNEYIDELHGIYDLYTVSGWSGGDVDKEVKKKAHVPDPIETVAPSGALWLRQL